MKFFPLLLFFVLFLAVAVSGQTNQNSSCPNIDITGGGVVDPGEPMTFTVNVENYDSSKLSFKWTTSNGDIIEGQGTQSIKVSVGDNDVNTTVTVEIEGLPSGCANIDSETASPICYRQPTLFDEFSIPASRIEKARLDNLISELGNNPNAQAFIVEYFKPNTPKKVIAQKIQKITDYFVNIKRLEKERFTILAADSEDEQNRTKFWIVPPGAKSPQP